jgi:hypothetical protein
MDNKDNKNQTDASISRDEVMDEMDDLEATAEMEGLEELPQDNDATVVLRTTRRRKATGGDSS